MKLPLVREAVPQGVRNLNKLTPGKHHHSFIQENKSMEIAGLVLH